MNEKPFLHEQTSISSNIVSQEELPERLKSLMIFSREEGQKRAEKVWDLFMRVVENEEKEIYGNDVISLATTYIIYFLSTWIMQIKIFIDNDKDLVKVEEILQCIFEGSNSLMKTAKINNEETK